MARSLTRNVLVGLAAGAAATAAMNGFWAGLARIRPPSSGSGDEPTTVKVARRGLRRVGVKSPSKQTREIGGQVVHWSYGTNWGMMAGLARSAGIPLDWGYGLPLGAALWALGDLWMTYAIGVAKHPREYPMHAHALALGAHLVYGSALWATSSALSKMSKDERQRPRSYQAA